MFKIQRVTIQGFWERYKSHCFFNGDVNIIIGRNGTGKTTFMNILHAVLTLDADEIINNDFTSVEIKLINKKKRKTIKLEKLKNNLDHTVKLKYKISTETYEIILINDEDRRLNNFHMKRIFQDLRDIKTKLENLVSVSSLTDYRVRNSDKLQIHDKYGPRFVNPVDYKLYFLLQELTKYQLELSQKIQAISTDLQKEVLASILFSPDDEKTSSYNLKFDKNKEEKNLINAYTQLKALDKKIEGKIQFHVNKIEEYITDLHSSVNPIVGLRAIEALANTRKIIEMSLISEEESSHVKAPIKKFIDKLSEFIPDKTFVFDGGDFSVKNKFGNLGYVNLSSGEKQLLILFIETLLQREEEYVFLADEPELSLHIDWQRKIIPAIKELNPNAQIIAATHSPEVASKYVDSIVDMESIVNAKEK